MARENDGHKAKAQEQPDESDHGVIVAGTDAHEREQSGKTPSGRKSETEDAEGGRGSG